MSYENLTLKTHQNVKISATIPAITQFYLA